IFALSYTLCQSHSLMLQSVFWALWCSTSHYRCGHTISICWSHVLLGAAARPQVARATTLFCGCEGVGMRCGAFPRPRSHHVTDTCINTEYHSLGRSGGGAGAAMPPPHPLQKMPYQCTDQQIRDDSCYSLNI